MNPHFIPHWLSLRNRRAHSRTGDPREDLGAMMFQVVTEQAVRPAVAKIIEMKPQEERREANRALLMALSNHEWKSPIHDDAERLSERFLHFFDWLPIGGWMGVACSLHSAQSLSSSGLVESLRRLRFNREFEVAACSIVDYATSRTHMPEPWLLLTGHKLGSRVSGDGCLEAA